MTKTFKHSGVEWLGEIPSHWEVRKIKFATKEIISGGTPKTSNLNFWSDDLNSNSYLWVAIEDMTNAEFIEMTDKFITKQGLENSSAKIVPPFTILYSIYASLGKIAYSDKCLTTNQAILGLVTKESYFYKYCFYSLMSLTPTLVALSNKTTQDNINLDILKNIKIPLPPLDEQRKIAEFLDEKCGKIAEFIAKKQALIALLKERKKALINEAVCGRLDLSQNEPCESGEPTIHKTPTTRHSEGARSATEESTNGKKSVNLKMDSSPCFRKAQNDGLPCHSERPKVERRIHNETKFKCEGALNSPCEFKRSGVEWLGEIPHHWEVRKLKQIANFDRGLNITKENLKNNGIFVVSYGEIHSKYPFEVNPKIHKLKCVDESYLQSNLNSLMRKGDFVFADTSEDIAGSGNFSLLNSDIPTFAGYHTIICRIHNKENAKFLAYEFESQIFRSQIQSSVEGVKVYSITQSILKNCNVWLPPKNEQQKIAEFLDKKCAELDRACALIQAQIEAMREYKSSLIDSAVRGKMPRHCE